jgi:hypothetical protein
MTDYAPEVSQIRLVIVDEEAGERHTVTLKVPFYEPIAHGIDTAERMTASAIEADATGYVLTLVHGKLWLVPDGWSDWWADGALSPCDGARALAAHHAFTIWAASRERARGEHGPSLEGLERRDFLLSAVLLRIVRGMSWRGAVENTLNEYEPESTARDSAALLQTLKRYLRGLPPAA